MMSEELELTKKENALYSTPAEFLNAWVAEADDADTPPAWRKMKQNVAKRLAEGTFVVDQNLAQSLKKFATGQLDESTARIISAIVLDTLERVLPNNRADHLRLAIDLLRTSPGLFVDIQRVIDTVSLKELRVSIEYPNRNKEQRDRDLIRLCHISLSRLDSETDYTDAKAILEYTITKVLKQDLGYYGITSKVLRSILDALMQNNPQWLKDQFEKYEYDMDNILKRFPAFNTLYEEFLLEKNRTRERKEQEVREVQRDRETDTALDALEKRLGDEEFGCPVPKIQTSYDFTQLLDPSQIPLLFPSFKDRGPMSIWWFRNGLLANFPVVSDYGDDIKKKSVSQLILKRADYLTREVAPRGLTEWIKDNKDAILESIRVSFETFSWLSLESIEQELEMNTKWVGEFAKAKEYSYWSAHPDVVARVDSELGAIRSKLEEARTELEQQHALEAEREISERSAEEREEIKKQFLLDQIKSRITYLKAWYGSHLGLDLEEVEGRAEEDANPVLGEVSMSAGSSLGLRQEQYLAQRQVLELHDAAHLTVFAGDTLEEMKARIPMVDFIGPHEIGHIVKEGLLPHEASQALQEQRARIMEIVDECVGADESKRVLVEERFPYELEEVFVDGIGFQLARKYGTSDIARDTLPDRIATFSEAFIGMMKVQMRIIRERATDEDMKNRYSVILLRFMAVCEQLLAAGEEAGLLHEITDRLSAMRQMMDTLFEELNTDTHLFTVLTKDRLIGLYKKAFENADRI